VSAGDAPLAERRSVSLDPRTTVIVAERIGMEPRLAAPIVQRPGERVNVTIESGTA
jgi:hypothetical protein